MMTAPEPDGIVWRKSSYNSGPNGGCVEVGWRTSSYSGTNGDCVHVGWRTSSYSALNGGCVEVAPAPDRVLARDSKDLEDPALASPPPPGGRSCTPSLTDHPAGFPPPDLLGG